MDIGLPERKPSRKAQLGQRLEHVKALRRNAELESQARKAECKCTVFVLLCVTLFICLF